MIPLEFKLNFLKSNSPAARRAAPDRPPGRGLHPHPAAGDRPCFWNTMLTAERPVSNTHGAAVLSVLTKMRSIALPATRCGKNGRCDP